MRRNISHKRAFRAAMRRGWWVLRTTDPHNPSGEVVDPATGIRWESLDAATPRGWSEAFRDEYLPGVTRARGFRNWTPTYPHEVVVVDPIRYSVVVQGPRRVGPKAQPLTTCIPAWLVPVSEKR